MESTDYEYYGTTLIEVDFKKSLLSGDIDLNFDVSPGFNKKKDIYVKGTVEFIVNGKSKGSIAMESIFKLKKELGNDDVKFSDFNADAKEYFIKPLLSELSLFISILSQKTVRLPIVLPIENIIDYEDIFGDK